MGFKRFPSDLLCLAGESSRNPGRAAAMIIVSLRLCEYGDSEPCLAGVEGLSDVHG
jgi:hypothetical protein